MVALCGKEVSLHQPIFIVGLHRTGSTLLKNVLNLNRDVAMATDEMDLSNPWHKTFDDQLRSFGDLENEAVLKKFVDFIYSGRTRGTFWEEYRTLGIQKGSILGRLMASDRSLKSIVSVLLDEYRITEGKSRAGVKYPVHMSRINVLYEWYPDAKVIFLVRDARAICASKVNDEATRKRKSRSRIAGPLVHYVTIMFFVFEFLWSVRVYLRFQGVTNFHKLRYEDLVNDPDRYMREICDFCEIPFDDQMMKATGKPSSHTGQVKVGFDKGRIGNWHKRLSKFDKWLITVLTKRSMNILGYSNINDR